MGDFVQTTILPKMMAFVNTKAVRAIKDGMMFSMPLIIVGAVFLLLFQLPIESLAKLVESTGVVPFLSHGYTSSFAITAMVAAIGIAYTWAKNDGWEPLSAGIISLSAFLILIPDVVAGAGPDGADVAGLDKTWLGGQGMIGAIIAGLLTGLIYSWFLKKDIRIKMPDGVPDGVAAAFTGLIPAACILAGAVVIYGICVSAAGQTPIQLIYTFLQVPLQGLTDSLGGAIVHALLVPFLWWFGVHGASVVGAIMTPILQANMLENAEMAMQGITLTPENAHILTESLVSCTMTMTGSGITIGLVIFMVFFAKSAQMRQVGKLGLGSGIFNINEPILFGTPIVMNPQLMLPFIYVPTVAYALTYLLTAWGILPITYLTVPWTTPPILYGFILGGWRMALWQVVLMVWSFFGYLPFARVVDAEYLAAETGEAEA